MKKDENDDLNNIEGNEEFAKELRQLRELAENGMELTESLRELKNSDDPLEQMFADHIIQFENASKNADTRTLREIFGYPEFPSENSLTDVEINEELEKARDILAENNIVLDTIYPTPNREVYRFIIEDLLEQNEGFMIIPGMTTHYIYEEFIPNHPEDIKRDVKGIIIDCCNRKLSEFTIYFFTEVVCLGKVIDRKEILEKLTNHFEIFNNLKLVNIGEVHLEMLDNEANATCAFTITHQPKGSEAIEVKALAEFKFVPEYDTYSCSVLSIPALGV